jgi:hypothetical protein
MSAVFKDVRWYNGYDCVGIVYAHDDYDGPKFYIGVGRGEDEEEDVQKIMSWGARFDPALGCLMFGVDGEFSE